MRRSWLLLPALCLLGCVSPREERARDYNADGVHLYQHGAYEMAQQDFQAALVMKPDDARILFNLAECYHHEGAYDQAERYYNQCLSKEPNHADCRYALARLLVQAGRQSECQRMIDGWLLSQPKKADPYALAGWFWHLAGDMPQAQARLQQALEIDPHHQRALIELGLLYESMQRADRAVVLYERVLADEPQQPEVKSRLEALLTKGAGKPHPE